MIISLIIFALLGLAVGSFLNLCIDRLPAHESIITPPSHCPKCNRKIATRDLIPILSYILLKGKCRYCQSSIPIRSTLVEAATSLIFIGLCLRYGLDEMNTQLIISLIYASIFIIIFFIDLEHELILNKVVYPSILLGLVISLIWPNLFSDTWNDLGRIQPLIGGAAGFCIMLLLYFVFQGGFGEGDIKLAAFMGIITGFPLIIIALLLSVMSGGIIAMILMVTGIRKRKDVIPFGPFMASSAMVTIIWGEAIWSWYINLIMP